MKQWFNFFTGIILGSVVTVIALKSFDTPEAPKESGTHIDTLIVEEPQPAKVVKETKPATAAKESKPAQVAKKTKPATTAKETKPAKVAKETKPATTAKETKPAKVTKETKPTSEKEVKSETTQRKTLRGMRLFDTPGERINAEAFQVDEVIDDHYALAHKVKWDSTLEMYYYSEYFKVLLTNDEGTYYYDKQVIKLPKGKCWKQIGIYKRSYETVPIVKLMDR